MNSQIKIIKVLQLGSVSNKRIDTINYFNTVKQMTFSKWGGLQGFLDVNQQQLVLFSSFADFFLTISKCEELY